jgi:transcriptional regulator with XRE-family HTH domain
MATQDHPANRGREQGRRAADELRRQVRDGRHDRGLSLRDVGRAVGLSASEVGRIERGLVPLDVVRASTLLAVVGLELSVRAYPTGQPIRDRAHAALLDRLRSRLHAGLSWRTEVPLPIPGDLRAWDAVIRTGPRIAPGWALAVEAETRPRDIQALERRVALKMRDSGIEAVILLLADTQHNRQLMRAHRSFVDGFPVPGSRAMELLGAGVFPGGSAVVRL